MNDSEGFEHVTWLEAAERSIADIALATAIADEIAELEAAESAAYEEDSMSSELSGTSFPIGAPARLRPAGETVGSTLRSRGRPTVLRRRTAAEPMAARSP
ncbi:hypothetical protein FK529_00435 [Tsukamurella asaccharolytica]|uniref:Uncharacterized protein n=1 Tax=Tsukamurella asaccharolytica TaxID=2592067 RepID=A0A5C5RGA9_9ACTN|nr:hypothetical protein [Tsukamurella asaccharolytica]TWS21125.1 hypothetical protein FK529_00435 [Tsukamurella asaccharolytica]